MKIKISKRATKTWSCNNDLTFNPVDQVYFFTDQQAHKNKSNESLAEIISEGNSVFDDNYGSEDEEGDILNSSKDRMKSSKIIAFWSCLVTLRGSCFNFAKKPCISELLRKRLVVVVTVIWENAHENRLEWSVCMEYFACFRNSLFWKHNFPRISEMMKIANVYFFSYTLSPNSVNNFFPAINFVYKRCPKCQIWNIFLNESSQ